MVAPVVFLSGFKDGFVTTWKAVVSLETASRDTQTHNLSRNASKCYAQQVVSLMNEKQSQNLLLKVDPLSTILINNLIVQDETRNISQLSFY